MNVVASQDFQRAAIYSRDALEIFLRTPIFPVDPLETLRLRKANRSRLDQGLIRKVPRAKIPDVWTLAATTISGAAMCGVRANPGVATAATPGPRDENRPDSDRGRYRV
jgi:hypothetical protein